MKVYGNGLMFACRLTRTNQGTCVKFIRFHATLSTLTSKWFAQLFEPLREPHECDVYSASYNTHVLIKHSVGLISYQHIIPCHELFSFNESLFKDNHLNVIYAMSRDCSNKYLRQAFLSFSPNPARS